MDAQVILDVLSQPGPGATTQNSSLRQKAHTLISEAETSDATSLPTTLLDLLSEIIKPMFTTTKHPALTSTGRKNLVAPPPASLGSRFLHPLDDEALKPWKTDFTAPLLRYVLTMYATLPDDAAKATLEAHFHLLVPPILNMIDDADAAYKASGCQLLGALCELLRTVESDMLAKTGLGDVFFDALKANFMLLPALTPEDESLAVLTQLYPAFLAVVDARYRLVVESGGAQDERPATKEAWARQDRLKLLLRHGVLASLAHLSSGQSFSNSTSIPLTTFLLSQIAPILRRMGIESVRFLREFLPVLRAGLMDPFALGAKDLVLEILRVLRVVLDVCAVRVRDRWWPEVLRGLVGCWVNCFDEESGSQEKSKDVLLIQAALRDVVKELGAVVKEDEWRAARERLIAEEADLKPLLES